MRRIGILSRQLLRGVGLLSFIAVLGLCFAIGVSLWGTLQRVQAQLNDAGQQAVYTFDQFLGGVESDLLATSDSLTAADEIDKILQRMLARQNSIFEVTLIDPQGEVLAQRRRVGIVDPTTLANQTWLTTVQAGEIYVGPVDFEEFGVPFVDVAVAVTDETNQFSATLLARVDLTTLWNKVISQRVGENGYVYITDETGQLIAYHDLRLVHKGGDLQELVGYSPQSMADSAPRIYRGVSGQQVIGVGLPLEIVPWFVVVEQPAGEALSSFILQVIGLLVALLVVLLLVYSTIRFVRNRIVAPLGSIQRGVEMLSRGELNYRIQLNIDDELGTLATAFDMMAAELGKSIDTLEERVAARTRDLERMVRSLEVGGTISRRMTQILNLDELLDYVVDHIQEEFGFYHTHVYLIDLADSSLPLAKGYGPVGEQMKAKGHHLEIGQGIVGTVASTNEAFLSNNVSDLLNFVPNPLLPETNSELAVPLRKGDQILGVLDVQSRELDYFTEADVAIMQSIANQTAVAIDNARLLEEAQEAVREVGRLNRRLTREGWDAAVEEIKNRAFRFIGGRQARINADSKAWLPPMKTAAQTRQLVAVGARETKNGAELAVPLVMRGEVIGVLGVRRDQTAAWSEEEIAAVEAVADQTTRALENARLSEEQERTIIQLRDIDRLKSEFLASMSHELRTPLNSIIGFADILLQGIDGDLSDMALTDVTAIHNSGKHLLALINDILDLSKIEAGRMELARNALDVPDLFNDVAASVSSLLTKKPVDLVIDIGQEELPQIWADPLRISQIVINLVSNAIKFTEEGKVTMKARVVENNLMEISVSDTGIGIPEDKFDLVFQHFRQVDSRTNRKFQGTGMGLAIAKQLTELHGGNMWLASQVGAGTTFYFTIPVVGAENVAQPA